MPTQLTPGEEKIIKRIESSGDRDHLVYGLSLLVPYLLIIGIGVWYSNPEIVLAGALIYALFRVLTLVRQDKASASLRSAIQKLKQGG